MNLTTVPTDFDANTIFIDLQFNAIDVILNYAFTNMPKLQTLNMENNVISVIQQYAFFNCTALRELRIGANQLTFSPETVPLQVYQSLTGLRTLYGSDNKGSVVGTFPAAVCTYLRNLETLWIDLYGHATFPTHCNGMTKLRSLYIRVTDLLYLKNTTLQALSGINLREFRFQGYHFMPVLHTGDANFLLPVRKVPRLWISYAERKANLKSAIRILLYPFRNRTMDSLSLDTIGDISAIDFSNDDFFILRTICVKQLKLMNDLIIGANLNGMVGSKLWKCLVSRNLDRKILKSFPFLVSLPNIRKINICCQEIRRPSTQLDVRSYEDKLAIYIPWPRVVLTLSFSDSLEWFSMSDIDWSRNPFNTHLEIKAKNLAFVDFSGLYLDNCVGRILGLEALKTLRITMWNCADVNPHFISNLVSLESLTFSSLNIGHNAITKPLLQNLSRLHTLNISDNKLVDLKSDFFKSQVTSLTRLDISNNNFRFIPRTILSLKNITYLDLSKNKISVMSTDEMSFINDRNISFNLEGNVLVCSCRSIPFLRWINLRKSKILDYDKVKCVDDKGIVQFLTDVIEDLRNKELRCVATFWMDFAISGLIALIFLIIIAFILHKFRADVHYVYARVRRYIRRHQRKTHIPLTTMYHAYVSYASANHEWPINTLRTHLEAKGFRLCIPDRDFIPGEDEVDNIINSIDNSKRVIFILTREFIENDWCDWQIKMARYHAFRNDNENFIVVIILDDIKNHDIPTSLKKIWIRVNCLRWPLNEDPQLIDIFWQKLENSLVDD